MRRVLVLLGLCLLLGACGEDAGKAFLDSRTPPSLPPRAWAPDGWAWGVIRIPDTPEIRYGVAAPAGRPKGHVIFLTGYGEPAEAYFETARELLADGWSVWTLEPHGQGGSGRFPGPRDVGRSAGHDRDLHAAGMLVDRIIRPAPSEPVMVAGGGTAAILAIASADKIRRIDGVLLWSPDLRREGGADVARNLTRIGLGFLRTEGDAWRRPRGRLDRRSATVAAWQTTNPDLRLGGMGFSGRVARLDALAALKTSGGLSASDADVMVVASEGSPPPDLCGSGGCLVASLPKAATAPHLSDDDHVRSAWLEALLGFAETLRAERAAHEK